MDQSRRGFLFGAAKAAAAGGAVAAVGVGGAAVACAAIPAVLTKSEAECTCAGYTMVHKTGFTSAHSPSHTHTIGAHSHCIAIASAVPNGPTICPKCNADILARNSGVYPYNAR
jgi:hypothetical protein